MDMTVFFSVVSVFCFVAGLSGPPLIEGVLVHRGEKKERDRCAGLVRAALEIPRDLETHEALHDLLRKIDPSSDPS